MNVYIGDIYSGDGDQKGVEEDLEICVTVNNSL